MAQQDNFTEFNEGGSHEQNPLGGIPQGVKSGTPVSTEENETKYSFGDTDYVFSNNFTVNDAYIKAFGLPKYTKGLKFSDASKKVVKVFEDRSDNASTSTKKAFLNRLVEAQETARLEKAAREANMTVEEYMVDQAEKQMQAQLEAEQQNAGGQQAGGQPMPGEGEVPPNAGMQPPNGQFSDGGDINDPNVKEIDLLDKSFGVQTAHETNLAGVGSVTQSLDQTAQDITRSRMKAMYLAGARRNSANPDRILTKEEQDIVMNKFYTDYPGSQKNVYTEPDEAIFQGMFTKQYADGGDLKEKEPTGGDIGAAAAAGGLSMISAGIADMQSNEAVRDTKNIGGSAAKYAAMGASAGSVVPGIGTAIGGAAGAIAGTAIAAASNSQIAGEKQDAATEAYGDKLKSSGFSFEEGGFLNLDDIKYDMEQDKLRGAQADGVAPGVEDTEVEGALATGKKSWWERNSQTIGGIGGLVASTAPFVGNLISGAGLERGDDIEYERVGKTYRPEFADERRALNVVDDSFAGASDRIAAATSGNLGAYRANILGSNIAKAKARQAAYSSIEDINRGERKALNADAAAAMRENVALKNKEKVEAAQNESAYQSAKSAYRTAAYEGLGKLGETIFGLSQYKGLTSYDKTGKKIKNNEED